MDEGLDGWFVGWLVCWLGGWRGVGEGPEAVQETGDAADARLIPGDIGVEGTDEDDVGAQRVRAVFGHHLVGRDHVAARFGHASPVRRVQYALIAQLLKRLHEL